MIYISQVEMLDKEEFVDFFRNNLIKTYIWDETRVLSMDRGGIGTRTGRNTHGNIDNLGDTYYKLFELVKEIKSKVSHDPRFSVLQNVEIVKYPCGACKGWHYDRARPTTTGASITYINDDYIGGHTIVEGVDVQPMAGRTVYFDGLEFRHGVSNVLKRDRYTISMWYGKDESMPINDEFLEI